MNSRPQRTFERRINNANRLHYLISWENENSVSVVSSSQVTVEKASVGDCCEVKIGKKSYTGVILGIGTKEEMEEAEKITVEEESESEQIIKDDEVSHAKGKRKKKAEKDKNSKRSQKNSDDKPKKDRKQNILAITDHGHGNKSVTTTAVSVSTLMTSTPSTSTATMQDSTNVTQMPSLQLSSDSEYMEISSIESDNEIETRLEELEVKVGTIEKVQCHILETVKRLETSYYLTSSSNYQEPYNPWSSAQNQYFYQSRPLMQKQQQPLFSSTQHQDDQSSMQLQPLYDVNTNNQQNNLYFQQECLLQQQPSKQQSKHAHIQGQSSDNQIHATQQQEGSFHLLQQGSNIQQPLSQHQKSVGQGYEPASNNCAPGTRPCQLKYHRNALAPLLSSEIPKQSLRSIQSVLDENIALQNDSSAGTLCQRLAKEAIFGEEVMKKCTPYGTRDCPGLPQAELFELKMIMFRLFPKFHGCPGLFESTWKTCITSVEQACKRLRMQKRAQVKKHFNAS